MILYQSRGIAAMFHRGKREEEQEQLRSELAEAMEKKLSSIRPDSLVPHQCFFIPTRTVPSWAQFEWC